MSLLHILAVLFTVSLLPCAVKAECSLCPDGGPIMLNTQRIPGQEGKTCSDIQSALTVIAFNDAENCKNIRQNIFDTSVIDLPSFCGCVDVSPPNACPLCSQSSSGSAESSLNECVTTALLAPFVVDEDYCESTIQSFEGLCCKSVDGPSPPTAPIVDESDTDMVASAAGEVCSICSGGQRMLSPNKGLPMLQSKTCFQVENALAATPMAECAETRESFAGIVDIEAFCECEGHVTPVGCDFCDNDFEKIPRSLLKIPGGDGVSCIDMYVTAPFVADPKECDRSVAVLERGCCRGENKCSVCGAGRGAIGTSGAMQFPNRKLWNEWEFCRDIETMLSFATDAECDAFHQDTGSVQLGSYCGCPAATADTKNTPPDSCIPCREGTRLTDDIFQVSDANGFTCQTLNDMARHIVDDSFCTEITSLMERDCCLSNAPFQTTEEDRLPNPVFGDDDDDDYEIPRPSQKNLVGAFETESGANVFSLLCVWISAGLVLVSSMLY